MDQHPVQGGVSILLGMLHATETGISSGRVGLYLTLPLLESIILIIISRHRNRAMHFTPLVFKKTEGMADECLRYHSRLAELLSAKSKRATLQQFHGSGRKFPLQFCGARSYA